MAESSRIEEIEARFNSIIEEYGKFLRQAIIQVCPKDLGLQFNDIEQEARVRLWRALQNEREIQDPASYLYKIAVTTTLDAIRRVKTRREDQLLSVGEQDEGVDPRQATMIDPAQTPEQAARRQQLLRKVKAALARLPENRRRALGLYLAGMTTQEIAELLGWTEPKARNLVYRGLKDLRAQLKAEGIDYEID